MTLKAILTAIRDDLGSQQIHVRFEELRDGIRIHAEDEASRLIAKRELSKRSLPVIP